MPNWCDCDLSIGAVDEDKKSITELKKFVKFAKSKDNAIDTEKFIPYPKKLRDADIKVQKVRDAHRKKQDKANFKDMTKEEQETWIKKNPDKSWKMKDGFNNGGYDWCCKNWGTKWGICDASLEDEDYKYGRLNYQFKSAWSPPAPVIVKMSKLFPTLTFDLRYFECGGGYNGWLSCRGGIALENKTGDYFGNRGG